MGGAVVEVGCYRGGLTAQLAHLCRRLGKAMYVVDVCPEYLEIAKISIRAVTGDDHVLYYRGDLAGTRNPPRSYLSMRTIGIEKSSKTSRPFLP
jgi:hypothetical protein